MQWTVLVSVAADMSSEVCECTLSTRWSSPDCIYAVSITIVAVIIILTSTQSYWQKAALPICHPLNGFVQFWPPSNTQFLGLAWVSLQNSILIGSTVFAGLTLLPKPAICCDLQCFSMGRTNRCLCVISTLLWAGQPPKLPPHPHLICGFFSPNCILTR